MRYRSIQYADDDTNTIARLLRLRIPSLAIGLFLGISLSFVTSRFEEVLSKNIQVAFFIPFIVYMADAVGTQTQSIYVRDLKTGHASFRKYLAKESCIGIILGAMTATVSGLVAVLWLHSMDVTFAISFSVFVAVAVSPIVSLVIAEILELEHSDPAVGAGPIATVIQDTLSVLIYGLIASAILL